MEADNRHSGGDLHPARRLEHRFFLLEHGNSALHPVPVPINHSLEDAGVILVPHLPSGMYVANRETTNVQLIAKGCGVHGVRGDLYPTAIVTRVNIM